jgi:hypothetical protein
MRKAAVKSVLATLGYRVQCTRHTPRQLLEPENLRVIEFGRCCMPSDVRSGPSRLSFVQVGGYDGITPDTLRKYIEKCVSSRASIERQKESRKQHRVLAFGRILSPKGGHPQASGGNLRRHMHSGWAEEASPDQLHAPLSATDHAQRNWIPFLMMVRQGANRPDALTRDKKSILADTDRDALFQELCTSAMRRPVASRRSHPG